MERLSALVALPVIAALDLKDRIVGPGIEWRGWFAWHPVTVRGERVWLRWVERVINLDDDGPTVIYRLPIR